MSLDIVCYKICACVHLVTFYVFVFNHEERITVTPACVCVSLSCVCGSGSALDVMMKTIMLSLKELLSFFQFMAKAVKGICHLMNDKLPTHTYRQGHAVFSHTPIHTRKDFVFSHKD